MSYETNLDIVKVNRDNFITMLSCYNTWTYNYYKEKYKLSQNVSLLGMFINLNGEGQIIIGDGTYIGDYTRISACKDTIVSIGKNCAISHRVYIYTSNRTATKFDISKGIGNQEYKYGNVTIGDNCLLGVGSVILQGVTIGENCFIGANAVVTHDIPEYSVVGGVPARIIKTIEY